MAFFAHLNILLHRIKHYCRQQYTRNDNKVQRTVADETYVQRWTWAINYTWLKVINYCKIRPICANSPQPQLNNKSNLWSF